MKDFIFLTHELKQGKTSLGFVAVQNTGSLKPCYMLLKQANKQATITIC